MVGENNEPMLPHLKHSGSWCPKITKRGGNVS